jgi:murein DD-endopeptidase MepM/ murein hydrolase activator NlpD
MQQAYEDRISALRAQVDRITSRQLLDQQLMENKVSELLSRQAVLSERHGILGPLIDKADGEPAALPESAPTPAPRPDRRAEAPGRTDTSTARASAGSAVAAAFASLRPTTDAVGSGESVAERADRAFLEISRSLKSIEMKQIEKIRSMVDNAYQTAEEISAALADAGLEFDIDNEQTATGGPLITADPVRFDTEISQLDEALKTLDEVKEIARQLPFANPVPGARITSSFGMRRDPILGTRAHHSGMDFRASPGDPIRATGAGTVVAAGWNGGYGRMVEIDHGRGIVTRYAHLSRIAVKEGDRVTAGRIIGRAGTSGRSTGPHLHYEVRLEGAPTNPLKFLRVGRKIAKYL